MTEEFESDIKKLKFSKYDRVSKDKLLVNGDFFISFSKFKGKIQAFHVFNMRYVAIVNESDMIEVYNVYEKE